VTDFDRRQDFVDWVKNTDLVQLDDFTPDGFKTVYLDADELDPKQAAVLRQRAKKAGYDYVTMLDQQGRIVFSTTPNDRRVALP